MNQSYKGKKAGANNTSAVKLFLLIFIFCIIFSNLILASSVPASDTTSTDSSITDPSLVPDEDGLVPVYRKGMVSAGLYHTVLLREDGRVYCWGDNSYGQLGTGSSGSEESPTLVPDLVNIVMVQAGAYHTLALSEDGTVYAWGRNTFGQLGDGTSIVSLKPVRIDSIPPMKEIAAGAFHSLALSIDGKVYAWGNNNDFQVGDVLAENIVDETGAVLGKRVVTPQLIVESDVKAISAGGNHSLYLRNDGQVFAWGSNKYGQLGDGSQVSRGLPAPVYGLSSIIKISAGYSHNLALEEVVPEEGETQDPYQNLYVWGSDSDGQLGLGEAFDETRYVSRPTRVDITNDTNEKNDRISLIQAGYANSMITVPVIKNDKRYDSIFIWGNNTYGQLGIGDLPSQNAPVPLIATSNGWTGSEFLPFQSVAIGGYHMVFLSVKGFVGIVGRANKGQLGNVSSIDSNIPIGVAVPDAIAPEWASNDILQGAEQNTSLLLTCPQARDNIKVTGYEVSYISNLNQAKDVELGLVTQYNITDHDRSSPQIITVRAVDASGNRSTVPLEYQYKTNADQIITSSETGTVSDSSQSMDIPAVSAAADTDSSVISGSDSSEGTTSSQSDIIDEIPVITPQPADPLLWNPILYGTITPLEVPWNVDYLYGAGVVLPPKDYTWIIAVSATIAIVSFFLFLGVVSFRKRHKGQRLFQGVFKDIGKSRSVNKEPLSHEDTKGVVHIGDGIDLVQDEDAEDKGLSGKTGKNGEPSKRRNSKKNKPENSKKDKSKKMDKES